MSTFETLYPGDAENASQDFKLVKVARGFRSEFVLTNNSGGVKEGDIELAMYGYIPPQAQYSSESERAERSAMAKRMREAEDRLVALGVPKERILNGGVAYSEPNARAIQMYTRPRGGFTAALYAPPIPFSPTPSSWTFSPFAAGPRVEPQWPSVEAAVVADMLKGEISTELSINFLENKKRVYLNGLSMTVGLGPDGKLGDVSVDASLAKLKLKERWLAGVITDVKVSLKASANMDVNKAELKGKLKAVLAAEIGIPDTDFRIGAEIAPYVDHKGGLGGTVQFTIFTWK